MFKLVDSLKKIRKFFENVHVQNFVRLFECFLEKHFRCQERHFIDTCTQYHSLMCCKAQNYVCIYLI